MAGLEPVEACARGPGNAMSVAAEGVDVGSGGDGAVCHEIHARLLRTDHVDDRMGVVVACRKYPCGGRSRHKRQPVAEHGHRDP